MASFRSEVFEAFREVGVPEEAALKAAQALSKPNLADLKGSMTILKWMMALILIFQAVMFVKICEG